MFLKLSLNVFKQNIFAIFYMKMNSIVDSMTLSEYSDIEDLKGRH